ncbi:MAG TPA: hypothetical protein VMT70_16820 [Vicinamibacteria bacterium]|nr:hypothetical protein [Vicinamibacteria bacterium]
MKRTPALALALAVLLSTTLASAQTPPGDDKTPVTEVTDLVNTLLGGLLGTGQVTGEKLQKDVEEAGGLPFRRDVPLAFLGKDELAAYLKGVLDDEYPAPRARADERLLEAFDLLPPATDLRALRARVLEENVAGFYDERPGKRRLFAVSEDRSFSPMNQIVLVHELRHALQDQYEDLGSFLPDDVSDFDDRRMAWVSLLEGDATFVMERFVELRLGSLGLPIGGAGDDAGGVALGVPGLLDVPGAPPVVRDQLVQPYLVGLQFARALWARGGASALRDAWRKPPESTEQVLHPDKFFARERPRSVSPTLPAPPGARLVSEGVLGELLIRTLVGEGAESAAAGWGGDGWRLWDVGGRTALAWRSEWDVGASAVAFHSALRARFARLGSPSIQAGWEVFPGAGGRRFAVRRSGDAVELASAEDGALLGTLIGR